MANCASLGINVSKKPLTPDRKHLLELYCKCLRRAERRIIIAGHIANARGVDISSFRVQRPLIEHIAGCIKRRGVMPYGSALLKLQIARSRYAAELEGLTL